MPEVILDRREFIKGAAIALTLAGGSILTGEGIPVSVFAQSGTPICDYTPRNFNPENCENIYPELLDSAIEKTSLLLEQSQLWASRNKAKENLEALTGLKARQAPINITPEGRNRFSPDKLADIGRITIAYERAFGLDLVNNINFVPREWLIYLGKGRAPGFFNHPTKTATMRNDLGADHLAHELGHGADSKYQINKLFAELNNRIDRSDPFSYLAYASGYAWDKPDREDVAEFFQIYVGDGNKLRGRIAFAKLNYPEFGAVLSAKYALTRDKFKGEEYLVNGRIWKPN